jgi:hypothetical protein
MTGPQRPAIETVKTGTEPTVRPVGKITKVQGFDWHSAPLTARTLITPDYRNTQNVRRFFITEIGTHFSFNIAFMAWMKENTGKALGDAADEWRRVHALIKAGHKAGALTTTYSFDKAAASLDVFTSPPKL